MPVDPGSSFRPAWRIPRPSAGRPSPCCAATSVRPGRRCRSDWGALGEPVRGAAARVADARTIQPRAVGVSRILQRVAADATTIEMRGSRSSVGTTGCPCGQSRRNARTARTRRWSSCVGSRPSLEKIVPTCPSTVLGSSESCSAIATFDRPLPRRRGYTRTSVRIRGVRLYEISAPVTTALPDIDFQRIRPYGHPASRSSAFEELASILIEQGVVDWPDRVRFHRYGNPDGGREGKGVLPNGDVWAWQAKHLSEFNASAAGQVTSSVRRALGLEPN